MPPKSKFTREEIIDAALQIVKENGMDALTARSLGNYLGSSACPIFTVFKNMDEVQQAVLEAAKSLYKEYVTRGLADTPAFKGVGTQYILFAAKEPKLFHLLFMTEQEHVPDLAGVLPLIDENYNDILLSITTEYKIAKTNAEKLYKHLWIYTHGIATLCATKMCCFTKEDISKMMTEVFISLFKNIKEGETND